MTNDDARISPSSDDRSDAFFAQVYDELRTIAHARMRGERTGDTLQSTELVHEAYLRLRPAGGGEWPNRGHFFATGPPLWTAIDFAKAARTSVSSSCLIHMRTRVTSPPSRAARAAIFAELNRTGATADQMAKKYGVSRWTIYGWRKKSSAKPAKRPRKPARPPKSIAPGTTTAGIQEEIRAVLPGILREEIASALRGLIRTGAKRRGWRGGRK